MEGSQGTDFQSFYTVHAVVDWASRTGEVKHVVNLLFGQKNEILDVMFDEAEIFVPGEMSNIRGVTGD